MRGKTNSKRFPKTSFPLSTSKNTFSKNVVLHGGSRGAPFGEGTLSPLRRYLKPLPKGGRGGGGERGTEAPLRYLKGASKASKVS